MKLYFSCITIYTHVILDKNFHLNLLIRLNYIMCIDYYLNRRDI